MEEDKKLYTIEELIAWLENPGQHWEGKRPLLYARGAREQLKRIQQSVQRTAFAAFCGGVIFGMFVMFVLGAVL